MPDLDLNPKEYRTVERPRASRLNAILVLVICLAVSPLLVILGLRDQLMATVIVISVAVGLAGGWAITRIADPKPYIAEDDPEQLKNPPPKTWVGRFVSRPAGWDAKGAWTGRMIAAVCAGLVLWWIRSRN
jgi:hypothetical protein